MHDVEKELDIDLEKHGSTSMMLLHLLFSRNFGELMKEYPLYEYILP